MHPLRRRPAVCIVKVDPQSWGPLITVTVSHDLVGGRPERPENFTDMDDAIAVVAAFLNGFTRDQPSA